MPGAIPGQYPPGYSQPQGYPGAIPGFHIPPPPHGGKGKGKGNVWRGFYQQTGQNHPMVFKKLKIKNNLIEGKGKDDVGKFKVHGMANGGQIKFNKDYKKKHSVIYEGQWNPAGQMTGHWNIPG
jgi:hypothetical protein